MADEILSFIKDRFDQLDRRLGVMEDTLREVHREQKKTNSRVTHLEVRNEIDDAVENHAKEQQSNLRFRITTSIAIFAALIGAAGYYVLHVIFG